MATRALTPVAQRQSRDSVSARKAPGRVRDWRQVLLAQDAEAIWNQLSLLVRTSGVPPEAGYEQVTQQLFLELLATDRVRFYVEENYSDSDIKADLLSMLCE
jgi:hypothetical protein